MKSFELITASRGNQFMADIAGLYARALESLGHRAMLRQDVLPGRDVDHSIIVAPQEYVPLFLDPHFGGRLGARGEWSAELRGALAPALLLCVDQPGSHFFELARATAAHSAGVLDISADAARHWTELGVPALHWPLPFACFAPSTGPKVADRPVDVLFLGVDSPRRHEFFSANCEIFEPLETRWLFQRHAETILPGSPGAQFGGERSRLLHSAKILINIHATRRQYFEWHRAMLAIAHGCVYVTETSQGAHPLRAGEHLLEGPFEDLATACADLLRDGSRMQSLADAAQATLAREFDHAQLWPTILDGIDVLKSRTSAWRIPLEKEAAGRKPALEVAPTRAIAELRLVRRSGLEREKSVLTVAEAPCVFALKPAREGDPPAWPKGPWAATISFDPALDGHHCRIVIKENVLEKVVPHTMAQDVSSGRLSFVWRFDNVLDCAIECDFKPGTRFPSPKLSLARPDAAQAIALLETREEMRLREMESLQQATLRSLMRRQRSMMNRFAERQAANEGDTHSIEPNFEPASATVPAVSVIIPLHNYRDFIADALHSVETAARTTPEIALEIIVVDDASTDAGGDIVREFQRRTSVPLSLVTRHFNLGLAEARNLGMRLARANHVFFLDADNLLLPHGLARLYAAVQRENAVAAYGILAVFVDPARAGHGERDSLLSFLPWSRRHLLMGNYIDATALFRKSELLALGGYDFSFGDLGAPGWEDYDLWLRLLAAEKQPVFVPTVIGKYRRHGSSMSDETTDVHLVMSRLLEERYGHLLGPKVPSRKFGYPPDR